MRNRVPKAIDDYRKLTKKKNRLNFYAGDIKTLYDMSKTDSCYTVKVDVYDLICNAMMAGMMIGYRTGKREVRKKYGYNL